MPTKKTIKQRLSDQLKPALGIEIFTARQVEDAPAEFAVIHLGEWDKLHEDFDGNTDYQGDLVIEYFGDTDDRLEALEEQGKAILKQAYLGGAFRNVLNHLSYNGGRFADIESGEPVSLVQSWTIHFED